MALQETSVPTSPMIVNRTYDELEVGQRASLTHRLTENDIALFAAMSGDVNPAHLDQEYAKSSLFHEVIGHGMWGGSLISAVLGTQLPGPGTIYLSQTLHFKRPVRVGDVVEVSVTVKQKADRGRVVFDCDCKNQNGDLVIEGEATVLAPTEKISRPRSEAPRAVLYERGERMKTLVEHAQALGAMRTGIVHPVDENSLSGALDAAKAGLIDPLLIGPEAKIKAAAEALGEDISAYDLVDTPHSHAAAEHCVELARRGEIQSLMKGALHTDELMAAVVSKTHGLRTERRISHVYVMDTPAYDKLLLISDAAINIQPNLEEKRHIVQNAIDVATAIGLTIPKVALLSVVETVYPKVPSTIDAAALCKMADRGQIKGAILDGPLAFDNAVSPAAVKAKGLTSPVAGQADILIVPNLEAGNMLAKQLDYLAGAVSAGVVMGAQMPIILTSRAEGRRAREAACAVARLVREAQTPDAVSL